MRNGVRVPGTQFELEPVQGAFNIGTLIRWLDFNDAFLAAEWGHPSDNLAGILAVADYLSRRGQKILIRDILTYMIKAHEIQGVMSLKNSFNRQGFDHIVLVKLATAAITTYLLGGNKERICDVQSQVWIDGPSLRTYRHAPNVGARKSWAASDASSRGVWLALMTMRGELGYPSALSTKKWGFYAVNFANKSFEFERDYDSYVMEHVLFKAAFPAEIHAQTAVEAAIKLHPEVKNRLNEIKEVIIRTQESAVRIISKTGKLYNPADRDHCIQYMTAIGLIFGKLTAEDYSDEKAKDPRIDKLRKKMILKEDKQFSKDYLSSQKRSIANAVQVFFKDGSKTDEIVVEYPYGHLRRRKEGLVLLENKFQENLQSYFPQRKAEELYQLFKDKNKLERMPVEKFMTLWVEDFKGK
jgi:2-methylcitrate dehydratase